MVQASYLVNYSKLDQTKLILQKITTFLLLAGFLTGSAVKTCCTINGQPWRETAGNTNNKPDKLVGESAQNKVSYALTGFTTDDDDSWARISINFQMRGGIYNCFRMLVEQYSKEPGTNDEKSVAKKIFRDLSGENTVSKTLKENWNPLIKNEFEDMKYEISVKIGVASSTLWNRFWEDEAEARYFIKIIENAPNPLGNWWIPNQGKKQKADSYIKACRNYGADFNLKFERDGWFWAEFNSYLVVAQKYMPRTIKEIWYHYTNPDDLLSRVKPIINLYIINSTGSNKIAKVQQNIFLEFSRWLTGRHQPKYSCWLDASDLQKEFSYGVPIQLTFRFFYREGDDQYLIHAVQEAKVILHQKRK